MDTSTVYRDVALLHPKMKGRVETLRQNLVRRYQAGTSQFEFKVFETFRSPARQLHLRAEGRSKAGPWQSAHQYGLAVDFVPFLNDDLARRLNRPRGWHWPEVTDEAWEILKEEAAQAGLVRPISWDKPHVEHPDFDDLFRLMFK